MGMPTKKKTHYTITEAAKRKKVNRGAIFEAVKKKLLRSQGMERRVCFTAYETKRFGLHCSRVCPPVTSSFLRKTAKRKTLKTALPKLSLNNSGNLA